MLRFPALAVLLLLTATILAEDDPRFATWMKSSLAAFEKNHLVADIHIEGIDHKGQAQCHYDRYPEVERIQAPNGDTFARKKGKHWVKSDDWAETGKPVKAEKRKQLDEWVEFVNVPLTDQRETRDKKQGAIVVRMIDQTKNENNDDELVFEIGRENQTGVDYPKYTFIKYKNSAPDDALLYKFSGPVFSEEGHVMLNIRYGLLIKMNVNWVTPTPTPK